MIYKTKQRSRHLPSDSPMFVLLKSLPNTFFLPSKCDNINNTQPHYYSFPGYQFHHCHLSVSRLFGMMRTPAKKETCSYSSGLESKERFRDQKSRRRRVLINDENPPRDDQLLETRFALTFLTWARLKGDSLLVTGDSKKRFLKCCFKKNSNQETE